MGAAQALTAPGDGVAFVLDGADDPAWGTLLGADPEAMVREAVLAALGGAGLSEAETEISVTLADDAAVRDLNRKWRGKDKPTNVLSFPMTQLQPGERPGPLLGDLVLARQTVGLEAETENKTAADHFRHLVVHGTLHLLGYDHETDRDADRMEALEVAVLQTLGIADPYADDTDH